jgi:uncharacterized protein YutD
MKTQQFNYWKVIAILFFLFGVVLFFYSESKNKQAIEDYKDCINTKQICINALNNTIIGWHDSMILLGQVCFNITEEESREGFEESFFNLNVTEILNKQEVIK